MVGLIVVHAAFPAVFEIYPARQSTTPEVRGYIAVNDCNWMGRELVLVRRGEPDALTVVADCAASQHVSLRNRLSYIADVDADIWVGPWVPQKAELWTPSARAAYWRRMERLE